MGSEPALLVRGDHCFDSPFWGNLDENKRYQAKIASTRIGNSGKVTRLASRFLHLSFHALTDCRVAMKWSAKEHTNEASHGFCLGGFSLYL